MSANKKVIAGVIVEENGRYRLDDFELYQIAREYRRKLYMIVKQLPAQEKYCLGSQMRRAAVSITNNLAEGHGRWHYQENIQHCRIARDSIAETIDDLNTCIDEGYADSTFIDNLKNEAYSLIKRVNSYTRYLQRCKQVDSSAGPAMVASLTTHQ